MSATNRGAKRRAADYYPTPAYCVERLLRYVQLPGGRWLEPGAGDGAIIREVNANRGGIVWTAIEKRKRPLLRLCQAVREQGRVMGVDFLRGYVPDGFEVAIGNPPYSLATAFIERALGLSSRVLFLLRVNFLGSKKRIEFYQRVGVPDIYVIRPRPSFTGGGNDATEYAWFEFRPEWAGRSAGQLSLLEGR